jgi:hypothetical protein
MEPIEVQGATMNPNNILLTMLSAICYKLGSESSVDPTIAAKARELHEEWGVIVSRYGSPASTAALNEQMEAQAKDWGIRMVVLLEKSLAI